MQCRPAGNTFLHIIGGRIDSSRDPIYELSTHQRKAVTVDRGIDYRHKLLFVFILLMTSQVLMNGLMHHHHVSPHYVVINHHHHLHLCHCINVSCLWHHPIPKH